MWNSLPAVALWALTPFTGTATEQSARDLVALAAPDSFVAFTCADVPALRRAIGQNAWYHGLVDAKGSFHQALVAQDDGAIEGLAALAAVIAPPSDPAALAALDEDVQKAIAMVGAIEGGATAWLGFHPDDYDRAPNAGVVVQSGTSTQVLVETLRAVLDDEAETPGVVEDLGGTAWWTWTKNDEVVSLGALDGMTALLFGETGQLDVHRAGFLSRLGGDAKGGLHQNARYAQAIGSLRVPGQVDAFVDLQPLAAMLDEAMAGQDESAKRVVDRLGLGKMGWFALRLGVGAGEQLDSEAILHVPPQTLLSEMLDLMRPLPMDLVARAPADAVAVVGASYDVAGLVELGLRVAEEINPGSRSMVDSMLAMASANVGLDVRADIVDLLDGRFASFLRPTNVQPAESNGMMFPMAFGGLMSLQNAGTLLIGAHDAAALADALVQLVDVAAVEGGMDGLGWETETVGEGERHVLRGVEPMLGATPKMAAGDGYLVLSFDGSDPAEIAAPRAEGQKGVLDSALVGPQIRQAQHASFASAADTAKSMALGLRMLAALSNGAEVDPAELDAAFDQHFSGTIVRTVERIPAGVRFYSGAR